MQFGQVPRTKRHWRKPPKLNYGHLTMDESSGEIMAKRKVFVPKAIASWSDDELQMLKALAVAGASIDAIARTLNRTPSAVRNKAGLHGISLSGSRPGAPAFVKEIACA